MDKTTTKDTEGRLQEDRGAGHRRSRGSEEANRRRTSSLASSSLPDATAEPPSGTDAATPLSDTLSVPSFTADTVGILLNPPQSARRPRSTTHGLPHLNGGSRTVPKTIDASSFRIPVSPLHRLPVSNRRQQLFPDHHVQDRTERLISILDQALLLADCDRP